MGLRTLAAGATRAGRRPGPARLMGAGVVMMLALGAAGFALGHAAPRSTVTANPADAWLPSDSRGSLSLVNGLTGQAGLELVVPGTRGHRLTVDQQGETVLVHDPAAGTVTRIDVSQLTVGPAVAAGQGTSVFTGATATYLVDYTTGTATRIDPATLRATSPAFHLSGVLGKQAVVAADGTLWLPVLSDGTAVPVSANGVGTPVRVSSGGSHSLVMTAVNGAPVAVDQTTDTITAVGTGRSTALSLPTSAAGTGLLVPTSSASGVLPILATTRTPSLVLANVGAGTTRSVPMAPAAGTHQLGAPVIAGGRVYVPDYTAGTALVYDTARGAWGDAVRITGDAGNFDTEVVDGIVYFNDPAGDRAVAVSPDGRVRDITKTGPGVPTGGAVGTPTAGVGPTTGGTPKTTAPTGPSSSPVGVPPVSTPARPTTSAAPPPETTVRSTSAPPPPPTSTPPAAPLAPRNVTATAGDGYLDVSWQAPASGGPVSSYRVDVSPAGGTQTALSATSVRISGLTCATSYGFTVASVGTRGEAVAAAPVSAHPCLPLPDPEGLNLYVVPDYTRDIHVTWNAVTPVNGPLSYLVSWTSSAGGGSQTTTATDLMVTGLYPGHTYTFTLRADDDAGPGGSVSASAVPGSKNSTPESFETGVQPAYDMYTSYDEASGYTWTVPQGGTVTAWCQYDSGQTLSDSGGSSHRWVYVSSGGRFGWANTLWFADSSFSDSLLRCRSPITPDS